MKISTAKKPFFAFIIGLFILSTPVCAQVATLYFYNGLSGSYSPIVGGTVFLNSGSPTMNDSVSPAITIPNFTYDGNTYSSIHISTNGFITFGATAPSKTNYTPISSTETYSGCVSAFGTDLDKAASGTPEIRYQQVGNEFVVQWKDVRRTAVAGEIISFQVRLNLTTNVINVVYGGTITPGSNSVYPQIGLRGPDNTFSTNVKNLAIGSFTNSWVNALVGNANTNTCFFNSADPATVPSPGTTFKWTPTPVDMAALALLSPASSGCFGNNQTVTVNIKNASSVDIDFAVNPVTVNCDVSGPNPTIFPTVFLSNGTLTANTTMPVTISTTYDMTNAGTYIFHAHVYQASDVNPANDTMPNDTITVYPAPLVNLGPDFTSCPPVTLDAGNPGDTYLWNDNSTNQTLTVTASGTYSVAVTNGNGCMAFGSVNATILPAPVVNLGPDISQCGGFVMLDAGNPGDTYLWSDFTNQQTTIAASTGNYSVVVTAANGCSASDTVHVAINPDPVNNLGSDFSQCGGSAVLDAGNPGSTYLWNDNSTGQTLTVTSSGNYSVDVTTAAGCSANFSVNVFINPPVIVDLGPDTNRCGGIITLDAGNAGDTYHWSNNSTGETITVSTSGTYTVLVTDGNGCTGSDTVNAGIYPYPFVYLGPDIFACGGQPVLNAGNPGDDYLWSDNSTNQYDTITANGAYYVTVTNAGGCSSSDTVNVTIYTLPVVDLGPDVAQCNGTVFLDAGNPGDWYLWNDNSNGQTLTASSSGVYSVVVTDSHNCSATDTVQVTINPNPVVDFGLDQSHCGGTVTLDAGTPGANYVWNTGETTQTITVDTTGFYYVTMTLSGGCFATDSINIAFHTPPTVTLSLPQDTFCFNGGQITLSGESPVGGTWSGPGVNGSTFDPASAGLGTSLITYMFTDTNGCSGSAGENVFVDICSGANPGSIAQNNISIYPNPNSGMFVIALTSSANETFSANIFSADGKIVFTKQVSGSGTLNIPVDISSLANGIYFLRVTGENGFSKTEKIVKQY